MISNFAQATEFLLIFLLMILIAVALVVLWLPVTVIKAARKRISRHKVTS